MATGRNHLDGGRRKPEIISEEARKMMRSEFEKMIGLEIKQEEYEPIEAYYSSMPNSIDKQKFAKQWLSDGGIQKLFDKRAEDYSLLRLRFNDLAEQLERQADDNMELIELSNKQDDRIKELENKLVSINALTKVVAA
jgi:hypothetical protein